MATSARWPWIAPILLYAVSALEMIIMISPAAAYFYSVYTPLFHGLEQFSATAWLPQFFLPHLAHTRMPAFRWLSILGAGLTLVGLIGFLICAAQLYYGKFIRKRLVSGGLYGRVRHPQYLCLAVAGAGLLLLWPRFFILATYLLMLGLYYVLARHEEEMVRARYGKPAEEYMATVPMFNPFRGRAAAARWQPPARSKALAVWLATVVSGLALAFLLRGLAVGQLYTVRLQSPDVTTLSLRHQPEADIRALTESVLATAELQSWTEQKPGASLFLQAGPSDSLLKHLLIDLGMTGDAMQAIEILDGGEFAVVSQVVARNPGTGAPGDPLGLGTRIEPKFLAQVPAGGGSVSVTELRAEQFHPDFSRIRF